ncbi:MAG: outer membrane beta-barrel protein [Pseudomonadota bacterium]
MVRLTKSDASLWLGSAVLVSLLASFGAGFGTNEAQANQTASAERLNEAFAKLEARVAALAPLEKRVAALEAKLRQYENAEAPQQTAQPTPLLVSLAGQASEPKPRLVGTEKTALFEQEQPVANWNGLYWGASFGAGSGRSQSELTDVSRSSFSQSNNGSSQRQGSGDDPTLSTEMSSFSSNSYSRIAGRGVADWNEGAMLDLYLGANAHLTPRIIVGAQVESGLAQMRFNSRIRQAQRTNRFSDTSRSAGIDDDGSSTSKNTFTSNQQFTESLKGAENELELDWTVSVIGRAGYLATPTTLLYGLAGWTYGHFEVEDTWFAGSQINDFGSHGVTVGGGFEQKLSEKWSLRGEYRYTNFGKENFSKTVSSRGRGTTSGSSSSSSSSQSSCCGSSSSTSTDSDRGNLSQTFTSKYLGYFDNDMHLGRIGVTRYFSLWD